ncbi:MAG: amidohydrolase [Candidatus Falkowbacteria bacterium]|nr:amidohydrolase [Candidatus Falkowbacteria bacterium]
MLNCDLIIRGKYILTMNRVMEVISEGAIAVADKKIIAVSKADEILKEYIAKKVIENQETLVMPGLINTHTHVAMSFFRGLADDLGLATWLEKHIWPAEAQYVNSGFVKKSSALGCLEMLKAGVTCFNDMYFFEEETAKVAKEMGMRLIIGEGILGSSTPSSPTPQAAMEKALEQVEIFKDDELVKVALAPHSIYTCPQIILEKIRDIAREKNLLIHIHLAETQKEVADAQRDFNKTPAEYLETIGLLDKNVIAAHCVWLNKNDLEIIKKHQVKISHNPISNMKLASGIAPILSALKEQQIVVGLGTDSAASNNTLDLFSDMRVAALLQKVMTSNPAALSASDLVKMVTIDGARALGLDDQVGSLEIGKRADIITINLNQPHLQPIYNPYSPLVYCASAADVNDVIINGKLVMCDREVLTADEEKILIDAKRFKLN